MSHRLLNERDRAILWHPYTQEKTADLPITILKAQGSYLYDDRGQAYLDLISSWWLNLHGHGHPEITQSIYDQAQTLDHIMFAGLTHQPAVELCEALQKMMPDTLSRFFFSDNGSTSVEIALKMAYQYWYNQGHQERSLFLSFEGGYHGDTFGAMAVGSQSGYHDAFHKLLFTVLNIPFPETWDRDSDVAEKEEHALQALDHHLEHCGSRIAAIILEPLVQGASGMRMCRTSFIQKVVMRVRRYGILVVFDEVMTGFGRTGRPFALDHLNVTPDLLCLSKGLTGGVLPLALTIATDAIYQAFWGDLPSQVLMHGHSYTANPIACAAAITSLKLLIQDKTQHAIDSIHQAHQRGIAMLQGCSIDHPRVLGTIAAFDVVTDHRPEDTQKRLRAAFLEHGLLIRPLGTSVYLIPPYSTTPSELEHTYTIINDVLRQN